MEDRMFDVAAAIKDNILNYRLVADYFQRPAATERLVRRINEYNKAFTESSACKVNNEYFPQWMALAMQCFWILFGGAMLFEGHVGLGGFLTTLAIFRNSGSELS